MYATVSFRGGPIGGELRRMDNPPRRLQVPSLVDLRFYDYDASHYVALPLPHELEEYELRPARGLGGQDYDYVWINPAESLRKRIAKLEQDLADAREACERESRRADEMAEPASNWECLRGLVESLTKDDA